MGAFCAFLGFILLIPIVIVAAVLLFGAGAGTITKIFTGEVLLVAGIIFVFTLINKIFR